MVLLSHLYNENQGLNSSLLFITIIYIYIYKYTYSTHAIASDWANINRWVPVSSTSKFFYGCIRNLGFNPRLHQKLIGVLI